MTDLKNVKEITAATLHSKTLDNVFMAGLTSRQPAGPGSALSTDLCSKANWRQEAGILAAVPVWPQLNLPDVSAQQIESFWSRDADDNQQAADQCRPSSGEQGGSRKRKPPATKSILGEIEAIHKRMCKQEVEYLERPHTKPLSSPVLFLPCAT